MKRYTRRAFAIPALLLITLGAGWYMMRAPMDKPTHDDAHAYAGASVEAGEYLASAGNCTSCHTSERGDPYAGGVAFKTPYGTLFSTNITPDLATGIGHWSFADFYRSMRFGVRPDGSHLYPAFPYTDFARLTETDMASLYLFMQSLAPVSRQPNANELRFPFSLRAVLGPWKALFHSAQPWVENQEKSPQWNRGAYLVEGLGHCGACHTPRNIFGAENESLAFTGGSQWAEVRLGWLRPWSAVNLTDHSTGLASWSEAQVAQYLKTGINDKAVVQGPMTKVVMASTRYLSDADISAMAHYIKSLKGNAQPGGAAADDATMALGEEVYTVHCGSCHLPTGEGAEGLGVTLVGNPIVQAADSASLINVILYGPHLPARPFMVDRSAMGMYGKRLSDIEIAAVASYVRGSFGHRAGGVSPNQVHRQR